MISWAAFRADADPDIGIGHLVRCLSLAQAWQARGGRAAFLTSITDPGLLTRIELVTGLIRIPGRYPATPDLAATAKWAAEHPQAWMVVDGYGFDGEYHSGLRDAGARVLAVDDWVRLDRYHCDMLLDQNFGAEERSYPVDGDCTVLRGPRYALLAPEFKAARAAGPEPPVEGRVRLLVTMGGADTQNQTPKVLDALSSLDEPGLEVTVVIGAANRRAAQIRRRIGQLPGCRLVQDVPVMAGLMAWADIAVSASGATCWELACMGVPSVLIALAENQRPNAEALDEAGVFVNMGCYEDVSVDDIARAVGSLIRDPATRARMSERAQRLVDGRGAERVVAEMTERAS